MDHRTQRAVRIFNGLFSLIAVLTLANGVAAVFFATSHAGSR